MKLKIGHHEFRYKPGVSSCPPDGQTVPAPHLTRVTCSPNQVTSHE